MAVDRLRVNPSHRIVGQVFTGDGDVHVFVHFPNQLSCSRVVVYAASEGPSTVALRGLGNLPPSHNGLVTATAPVVAGGRLEFDATAPEGTPVRVLVLCMAR